MNKTVQPGMRFGRVVVVAEAPRRKQYRRWSVVCDCGNKKEVYHHCLYTGHTASCGCLGRERRAEAATKHGCRPRSGGTTEYLAYMEMLNRCYRSTHVSFKNYGGRGIAVCDRWRGDGGFGRFLADVGEKPKEGKWWLDRKETNGNYEPGNVRWATPKEQLRNTRRNRVVTYQGKEMCLAELAEVTGLSYCKLHWRLKTMTADAAVAKG